MLKGAPKELLGKLHLLSEKGERLTKDDFCYLSGGCDDINPKFVDDAKLYSDLVQKMSQELSFTEEEQFTIWRIVAAVLHIGNMELNAATHDEVKNTPCDIKDKGALAKSAELLGCKADELQHELTFRGTVGDAKRVACKPTEAQNQRDSLARSIYHGLFMWLVAKMNSKLLDDPELLQDRPQEWVKSIGLLDIYGFECFQLNDYEQLLINYTNEKLQKLYLNEVFEMERSVFKEEGIEQLTENFKYADRTTSVIELLDGRTYGKPPGILNRVDDYRKNEDMGNFLALATKDFSTHANFSKHKDADKFVIKHTARDVTYTAREFIEKNQDKINDDLREFMHKKFDPAISAIVKVPLRHHFCRRTAGRAIRFGASFRHRSAT